MKNEIRKIFKIFIFYKTEKNNLGFALLFSVIISSILLAVALGVSNVAFKEITFTSSAKNTNDATFAFDAGSECAHLNDRATNKSFPYNISCSSSCTVTCFGNSYNVTNTTTNDGQYTYKNSTLVLNNLGSSGKSCATVTIVKKLSSSNSLLGTSLVSKGYNIGGSTLDCTSSDPNRVERQWYEAY